jgi:hypothetical protein
VKPAKNPRLEALLCSRPVYFRPIEFLNHRLCFGFNFYLQFRELSKVNLKVRSGNEHECPITIGDSRLSLIPGPKALQNRPQG